MKVKITEDGKAYFASLLSRGFTKVNAFERREWNVLGDLEQRDAPISVARLFRSDTAVGEILNTLPGHEAVYVQVLRDLAARGLVEIIQTKEGGEEEAS